MAASQNRYKTFILRNRDQKGYMASPSRRRSEPDRCGWHTRHRAVCHHAVGARERAHPASAMYPHRCGVVSLEASIRSGNCSCCCCSAGRRAQRLELITAIKAVVLMVKEHTGSTTLTGWQRVAHAARHVCRPTSSLRRLAAGGCRTLPMDRQMMPAKWFCLVVSSIDVRSLGVWVRCGAGARG